MAREKRDTEEKGGEREIVRKRCSSEKSYKASDGNEKEKSEDRGTPRTAYFTRYPPPSDSIFFPPFPS